MAIVQPRAAHNQISIETENQGRMTLTLEPKAGLDREGDQAIATVQIRADLRKEDGMGIDTEKHKLLLGVPVGSAPGEGSVLRELDQRLNAKYREIGKRVAEQVPEKKVEVEAQYQNAVKVELTEERPMVRDLRAQKGEKAYDVTLYPMPPGTDASGFNRLVRETLNEIKADRQPDLGAAR